MKIYKNVHSVNISDEHMKVLLYLIRARQDELRIVEEENPNFPTVQNVDVMLERIKINLTNQIEKV